MRAHDYLLCGSAMAGEAAEATMSAATVRAHRQLVIRRLMCVPAHTSALAVLGPEGFSSKALSSMQGESVGDFCSFFSKFKRW